MECRAIEFLSNPINSASIFLSVSAQTASVVSVSKLQADKLVQGTSYEILYYSRGSQR